jgi:hypothetical protein
MKTLGEHWKELSKDEKQPYLDEAAELKVSRFIESRV